MLLLFLLHINCINTQRAADDSMQMKPSSSTSSAFKMIQREHAFNKKVDNCYFVKILMYAMLFSGCNNTGRAHATIITSVGYVFEAFSPYGMIRFFEFSDKGWNISENCLRDMYNYLEGLRRGALWAVKLYDASSYYGGGIFGASTVRLHNPNLCRSLLEQYRQRVRQRVPLNLMSNGTAVPFAVHIVMGHYLLEIAHGDISYKLEKIQQLICFPQSCTNTDLQLILEVYLFQSNHIVRNSTYLRHRIVTDDYSLLNDFDFYILILFICGSIFAYAIVHGISKYISTVLYRKATQPTKSTDNLNVITDFKTPLGITIRNFIENKPPELDVVKSVNFESVLNVKKDNKPKIVSKQRLHQLEDILNALSIYNVLYNLFESEATSPQTDIYVIFTIYSIYAHLVAEMAFMSNNLDYTMEKETNFVLKHSSYAIDVYFFVSGSKLAYQFFKTFPREKLNVVEQLMHVLKLILHKILCLTPSYTFCLFAEHLLDQYFHNNVAMEIPSYDYKNCQDNKLSNILYLDTFFPLIERCMPWTWFISLEVQFFIIACLVLLLAEIQPRYAAIIGSAMFSLSILAASLWELNPYRQFGYVTSIEYEVTQFNLIFDNICLRIIPYLMGICLGYILYKTKSSINLNIFVLVGGWFACLLTLTFFFLGFELVYTRINRMLRALLVTFAHTMWSMILLWTVLTGVTHHGEWLTNFVCFKYAHTLEKLSPICLLSAPIIIRLFVFTADTPIYWSGGQIFAMALAMVLTIYVCALLLHVLLDGPLCAAWEAAVMRRK